MRIVIKPLGLVVILVSVACSFLLPRFFPFKSSASKNAATVTQSSFKANPREQGNVLRPEGWEMYTEKQASATQSTVAVQGKPFKETYRFDIHSVGTQPWNIGFHNKILQTGFAQGEKLHLHFWARASQNIPAAVMMQKASEPYTESWRNELTLSTTWQEFEFDLTAAEYSVGGSYLSFLLGRSMGTIEIADIRLSKK